MKNLQEPLGDNVEELLRVVLGDDGEDMQGCDDVCKAGDDVLSLCLMIGWWKSPLHFKRMFQTDCIDIQACCLSCMCYPVPQLVSSCAWFDDCVSL